MILARTLALAAVISSASAEVYFKEQFDDVSFGRRPSAGGRTREEAVGAVLATWKLVGRRTCNDPDCSAAKATVDVPALNCNGAMHRAN